MQIVVETSCISKPERCLAIASTLEQPVSRSPVGTKLVGREAANSWGWPEVFDKRFIDEASIRQPTEMALASLDGDFVNSDIVPDFGTEVHGASTYHEA